MKVMEYLVRYGYEQLVFCHDPGAGLKALIAIHDTTLGPALGGVRVWDYPSEEEATLDVLRLARAMTYKAAVAGLNLGGGKAVIMGVPAPEKREAIFRSLGRFIASLGGRYIATEDVGSFVSDMEVVRTQTEYATGLPVETGGSGDPSPWTALGVMAAARACLEEVFKTDSFQGKRVAVQGLGKVGYPVVRLLAQAGAQVWVTDLNKASVDRAKKEFGATPVGPEEIYDVDCDIFSPNALGAVLNRDTIPRLKARIVCGGANNQLADQEDALRLGERGILYAPDYVTNGGGLINISLELTGYDEALARTRVEGVYNTIKQVLARAKKLSILTARAADELSEERLRSIAALKRMHPGGPP